MHPFRRIASIGSSRNERVSDTRTETGKIYLRLKRLAWLLDSSIPIPGTRLTIGLDALIGVVPILGDLIGAGLSAYILSEAARLGAPKMVLARMGFNIGVESVIGVIPIAGDLFDAAWKANQRNMRLLDAWLSHPVKIERSSQRLGIALIIALLASLALLGMSVFLLLRWVFNLS